MNNVLRRVKTWIFEAVANDPQLLAVYPEMKK
jgi:hypothetical protein